MGNEKCDDSEERCSAGLTSYGGDRGDKTGKIATACKATGRSRVSVKLAGGRVALPAKVELEKTKQRHVECRKTGINVAKNIVMHVI